MVVGTAKALGIAVAIAAIIVASQLTTPSAGGSVTDWERILNVGALILLVASVTPIAAFARQDADAESSIVAALLATAAIVPVALAEIGTVVAYVVHLDPSSNWAWINRDAVAIGVIPALIVWVLVGFLYRKLACPQYQNSSSYGEICQRMTQLSARLKAVCPKHGDPPNGQQADDAKPCPDRAEACAEAWGQYTDIRKDLDNTHEAVRWVLGTGYINLWRRIHRAEEALFLADSTDRVVAQARYDLLRLKGSQIDNRDDLCKLVQKSIGVLTGPASPPAPPHPLRGAILGLLRAHPPTPPPDDPLVSGIATPNQARATLREVRNTIDEFRDNAWVGLVIQRNHIIETVIYARVTSFLLLGIAVILSVPPHVIIAAAAYFVVGSLVGLISQLRSSSTSASAVEDYGLASARLIQTPTFSGLAAIGGVIVTSIIGDATHNSMTAAYTGQSISDVFNIVAHPFNVVVAAFFGLTPDLLFTKLQALSDSYKKSIGTSEASSGGQN